MKIVDGKQIEELIYLLGLVLNGITESFLMKPESQLPAKISVHPSGNDFINDYAVFVTGLISYFWC